MINLAIYFSEDSDLTETESIIKEYRGDVLISYDGVMYQVDFITMNRINHEYDSARRDDQIYTLENTVVVETVNKASIIDSAVKLVKSGLIKSFATINLQSYYRNTFPELQDIRNWKQVYPK